MPQRWSQRQRGRWSTSDLSPEFALLLLSVGYHVCHVCIYVLHMTRNRIMVANLSGYVSEILALQTWSKIDFPPEFQIRQMHSFPIMHNTMGSKVDGLAIRDHFLPKNGLKTSILGEQILDRMTSEGAGTPIFRIFGTFNMFP